MQTPASRGVGRGGGRTGLRAPGRRRRSGDEGQEAASPRGLGIVEGAVRRGEISVGELAGFAVVPTGLGGPALRFWALHRFGMPFRTIGVRSVAHAPVFNAPYVLAALLLGLGALLAMGPGHAPTGLALAPIGVIVVTVALAFGLVALSRSRWLEGRTVWRDRLRAVVSVVPDGHGATALVAVPAALPMGWLAVATWVLRVAASAGGTASHTVANTGINVETSALLALIVTLPTRNSTTALLPARPSDGPLMG